MASQSFSNEINEIIITKFKALKSGLPTVADKQNTLDILPQVHEVNIYESIFSPVIKCEIALIDYIGLFTNFPLSGEEILIIKYKNAADQNERTWTFSIEEIKDIAVKDDSRAGSYIITGMSIEGLANVLGTVQKYYEGTPVEISKQIFDEHIVQRIKQFYPSYLTPPIFAEDNAEQSHVIVVPNMYPIAAIDMVNELTYSQNPDKYTYLFYQNNNGFHFQTLQTLITAPRKRSFAFRNRYKYFSDEIAELDSRMQNETRVISKLAFNKRHSTIQKVAAGYFNNNLFEINIAQKAVHSTRTKVTDENITMIEKGKLNTNEYIEWATSYSEGDEMSNRTKYSIMTRAEHDDDYLIPRVRDRWGKDLTSKVALSQIDLTVVIPGTNQFVAGDLFYIEIPEFHGFEELEEDKFVSGMYLITEIKHIIGMGGYQTTVMKINKDSYKDDINKGSRYVPQ